MEEDMRICRSLTTTILRMTTVRGGVAANLAVSETWCRNGDVIEPRRMRKERGIVKVQWSVITSYGTKDVISRFY
jgi:hypothetical protein